MSRSSLNSVRDTGGGTSSSLIVAVVAGLVLLRVLVGYHPHSGQDNYHGLHSAYGGDFEAQRHWMELTLHLPVGEWYWYDLSYWGLDYPPISAYVSWICGWLSHRLVGPESVALETSRGFENPTHKAFMRSTVIVLDLLVYGTAVWFWTMHRQYDRNLPDSTRLWRFALAMSQPAILLIDHGHFQYNTTALGLSLWAFYFMTLPVFFYCMIGSFMFCAALSFKQMTLYYAPAVFFYLLGRCFTTRGRFLVQRFYLLGMTVVATTFALWWPFVAFGPEGTSHIERAAHVFRRIIPLQRGLFEGKVSNLWCVLSLKPIRIRKLIPSQLQPLAALLLTLIFAAPACYRLFRLGQKQQQDNEQHQGKLILYGATSSALAFFLASFQVHEKSLLLALGPASLLFFDDATFVQWFSVIAAWTLWPLLVVDRLQVAYTCIMIIFIMLQRLLHSLQQGSTASTSGFLEHLPLLRWVPHFSGLVMLLLHFTELGVTIPPHLPDVFSVLWSIAGCAFCSLAWLASCWHLYGASEPNVKGTKFD
jgi:alpha-1,3-glucosyltransferase